MADDGVGYGRPPLATRFKPGLSGNAKGRPKRQPALVEKTVGAFLDAPIDFREGGKIMTSTRKELALRTLIDRAVEGDVDAAESILVGRAQAKRRGDAGVTTIEVENWLPEFPEQSDRQRAQAGGRHDAHREQAEAG